MENPATQVIRDQIAKLVEEYALHTHVTSPFMLGITSVPPSGKVIGAQELKYMVEASLDGWLTTGRFNAEFEKRLAESPRVSWRPVGLS
jgi:CDP-6-deoxy-D-xylo-4-hexulose-3-dehydrase